MGFVVKADPEDRRRTVRVEVSDEDLAQDAPERKAARTVRAPTLADRIDALETELAALKARTK